VSKNEHSKIESISLSEAGAFSVPPDTITLELLVSDDGVEIKDILLKFDDKNYRAEMPKSTLVVVKSSKNVSSGGIGSSQGESVVINIESESSYVNKNKFAKIYTAPHSNFYPDGEALLSETIGSNLYNQNNSNQRAEINNGNFEDEKTLSIFSDFDEVQFAHVNSKIIIVGDGKISQGNATRAYQLTVSAALRIIGCEMHNEFIVFAKMSEAELEKILRIAIEKFFQKLLLIANMNRELERIKLSDSGAKFNAKKVKEECEGLYENLCGKNTGEAYDLIERAEFCPIFVDAKSPKLPVKFQLTDIIFLINGVAEFGKIYSTINSYEKILSYLFSQKAFFDSVISSWNGAKYTAVRECILGAIVHVIAKIESRGESTKYLTRLKQTLEKENKNARPFENQTHWMLGFYTECRHLIERMVLAAKLDGYEFEFTADKLFSNMLGALNVKPMNLQLTSSLRSTNLELTCNYFLLKKQKWYGEAHRLKNKKSGGWRKVFVKNSPKIFRWKFRFENVEKKIM
jgi:hypothetical protein